MLKHDEINIVKDFWSLLVKKIVNSLDFGDFRQIILYFGLSTWTHIEYRIKSSTVTYTFFCFFCFIICILFFISKNQLSIKQVFLICKMNTSDQYFWLEITNTYTTKQSIIFFINYFCTFCVNLLSNDILLMHKTYRPSILVFCCNLRTW